MIKDILGNSIHMGSYISYPNRRGSSMEMRIGRVIGMTEFDNNHVSLTVRGLYVKLSANSGKWGHEYYTRKVTVNRVDRVLEISRIIPDELILQFVSQTKLSKRESV